MSRTNSRSPFVHKFRLFLFLFLQTLTIVTSANTPTNPTSLLNKTTTPTASPPLQGLIPQNATSSSLAQNMFDYQIRGTPLVLRITETGHPFFKNAVNRIIDSAIRQVVRKIIAGSGKEPIENGAFTLSLANIDMRIMAPGNEKLTYSYLGDVLAGIWQYMNEEWSSFREMVFDIILFVFVDRWEYIGYGYLLKVRPVPPPEPSSSSLNRNASLALNEIE